MAGSQKTMRSLQTLSNPNKLQLHSHHDQSNRSAHLGLPLLLPQQRKILTLAMQISDNLEIGSCLNSLASDAEIEKTHSDTHKEGLKGMDLAVMEGTNKLEVPMEDTEQVMEKKKLLAEIAGMNSKSKAFHERSVVVEQAASNVIRICRFCGREFPSGRALGGHMRVHGALLDAATSSDNRIKHQKQRHKQRHEGKLRSNLHELTDTHVDATMAVDLSASLEPKQRQRPGTLKGEKASIFAYSEVNSESPLNVNSADKHLHQEEERNYVDELDLSYYDCSSDYGKSDNLQLLGGDCVGYTTNFDSKKHMGLYELCHNPKPNQRFMKEQYHAAQMRNSINANYHSNTTCIPSPPAAGDQTLSASPSPEQPRPCSECGKVFFSWKALFGHMRCHPEREWRGIQRPESSVELDCMARMIACRPVAEIDPITELGYGAYNMSNCIKVEKTEEITHVRKEITHASTKKSQENEEIAYYAAHIEGGTGAATSLELPKGQGPTVDADCSMHEQSKDGKDVIECTKSKHEALVHAHVEKTPNDWSPIWSSGGKRTKRRRHWMHVQQPALASKTISNEIQLENKQVPECKDQEDLDMANCLVLLSNAGKGMEESNRMSMDSSEESGFPQPGKIGRGLGNVDQWKGDSDIGNEVINNPVHTSDDFEAEDDETQTNGRHVLIKYQCSTCKKCFNSHQALGGHRASHRKMKGCFARVKSLTAADAHESSNEENDSEGADFFSSELLHVKGKVRKQANLQEEEECNNPTHKSQLKKKLKGHECSVCHRIFVTGQALGGHKRCHWTGEKVSGVDTASVASSSTSIKKQDSSPLVESGTEVQEGCRNSSMGPKKHTKEDVIDLNLPAPLDEEDEEDMGYDSACGPLMHAKPRLPNEAWNPAKVAQIPQVRSMQTF